MSYDVRALIRGQDLFRQLPDEALSSLGAVAALVCVEAEDWLFRRDDPASALYLVVDGSLVESVRTAAGEELRIAIHEAGSMVGETQLLSAGTRSSELYATVISTLLRLPMGPVEALLSSDPAWQLRMRQHLHARLRSEQLNLILPPLFGPVGAAALLAREGQVEWIDLLRGDILCTAGDPGAGMFVVVSGHLAAEVRLPDATIRRVGEIGKGETIGEMALITGEPRGATVRALRDSQLVRISRPVFDGLSARHPEIYQAISKLLIGRLQRVQTMAVPVARSLTLALLPIGSSLDHRDFNQRLSSALGRSGRLLRLDRERLAALVPGLPDPGVVDLDHPHAYRIMQWLLEQQDRYDIIVLECDRDFSPWTERCLMLADRVIRVASTDDDAALSGIEQAWATSRHRASLDASTIALVHPAGTKLPKPIGPWLTARPGSRHIHLREGNEADLGRFSRILRGQAVGLVLGGGGAKGLAHIGAIQALAERGIPIDLVGGTSMGSIIASQLAMGLGPEAMVGINRRCWVDSHPFRELTIPLVSVFTGSSVDRAYLSLYGDRLIEDLWLDFFAVSTNLSRASVEVLDSGAVFHAVRASAAYPCLTPPVIHGGDICVDGGVMNNLPVDVMQARAPRKLIAIDVTAGEGFFRIGRETMPSSWEAFWSGVLPFQRRIEVPTIADTLMALTTLSSQQRMEATRRSVDLYLTPPTAEFGLLDFRKIERIVEAGYRNTLERVELGDFAEG